MRRRGQHSGCMRCGAWDTWDSFVRRGQLIARPGLCCALQTSRSTSTLVRGPMATTVLRGDNPNRLEQVGAGARRVLVIHVHAVVLVVYIEGYVHQ